MTAGPWIDGVKMIGGFSKEFVDYYYLNEEAKNSLPSRFLKSYLDSDEYWDCFISNRGNGWNSYPTWSSLQLLTIAYKYMSSRKRVRYIQRIAEEMDCSPEEQTLMRLCSRDLAANKYRGRISIKTNKFFKDYFYEQSEFWIGDEPLFPPIIFKPGDVVCERRKKRGRPDYYIVLRTQDFFTGYYRGEPYLEEFAVLELRGGSKLLIEPVSEGHYSYWSVVWPQVAEFVPDWAIPARLRGIVEKLRDRGICK